MQNDDLFHWYQLIVNQLNYPNPIEEIENDCLIYSFQRSYHRENAQYLLIKDDYILHILCTDANYIAFPDLCVDFDVTLTWQNNVILFKFKFSINSLIQLTCL